MVGIACVHCGQTASVVKYGSTARGTPRCRCQTCGKVFALNPHSRTLSSEKEQAILNALTERISQRGIARLLNVSRDTIRRVRKKDQTS